MGYDPSILQLQHIKRMLSHAERQKMGKAGRTNEECAQEATAKSEKDLQNQIVAMLRRNGIWVVQQRMDKRSNVAVGTPDLLFAVNGAPCAWECKQPKGALTKEQKQAIDQMTTNGWRCRIIRSYDDALGAFNCLLAGGAK